MTLLALLMLSLACAALSVLVVSRRWAFIGEGIGHSGFGGAGTAWMAALLFPWLDRPELVYPCVILFSLLTAAAIGYLSHHRRIGADTAIGIFMVASLAWGFLARQMYMTARHGVEPAGFQTYLFGQMNELSGPYVSATVVLSLGVLMILALLGKEIMAYCFDPALAEASGVPAGLVHYLLLLLLAVMIVLGVRVVGSVLVPALLVLPGATAMLLSRRLESVLVIAMIASALAAAGGMAVHLPSLTHALPVGPVIVLLLFVQFAAAGAWVKLRPGPTAVAEV